MAERTVPIEFNDANIRVARKFKAQRDALVKALQEIADLGAKGETSARLGNIAHAALISVGQVRTP